MRPRTDIEQAIVCAIEQARTWRDEHDHIAPERVHPARGYAHVVKALGGSAPQAERRGKRPA